MGNDWSAYCIPDASDIDVAPIDGVSGIFNVQEWIEYLLQLTGNVASPGFTWGRSGASPPGTWLLNDSVVSYYTGRTVTFTNAVVKKVFTGQQNSTAVKLDFWYHDGVGIGLTNLGVLTTAAQRGNSFDVNFAVPANKQLAVHVANDSANSPQNIVVALVISGGFA